jgi:hypothetical protein
VRRHFSGSDNVYCVELEAGGLLHCRQPGSVEIPAGSEIGLRLSSTSLPVYPLRSERAANPQASALCAGGWLFRELSGRHRRSSTPSE